MTAQVTLTLLFPFLAFHLAESTSCLNLSGHARLTPVAWNAIHDVWGVIAHLAGGLIFIMAALLIPELLEDATLGDAGLVALVVAVTLVARAAVLWLILPILSGVNLSPPISDQFKVAILWGGLRGAVTLALALSVIEAPFIDSEIKHFVGIMATGYALMMHFRAPHPIYNG